MPRRIVSTTHLWMSAALIPVDNRVVRRVALRGSMTVPGDTLITVIDLYCHRCRRPFDDVADLECEAFETNEHLRGGPVGGERKARRVDPERALSHGRVAL